MKNRTPGLHSSRYGSLILYISGTNPKPVIPDLSSDSTCQNTSSHAHNMSLKKCLLVLTMQGSGMTHFNTLLLATLLQTHLLFIFWL